MKSCLARVAIGLGLLILIGAVVLLALPPKDREYAWRLLRWGESDVMDYTRFPERKIQNPPQASLLESDPHPEWFQTIEYSAGGKAYSSSLDALMEKARTQALIVIQDDKIVYEQYYNGYRRDSIVTSFSSVKSVNSAMIGIAIDEGLIGSVRDKVVQYLPELKGRGLDEMTVRDLLMMSSGIRYTEDEHLFPLLGAPFSDDALTYYYPDLQQITLSRVTHGTEPVGQYMHYNNYHPILEGMILERVSGMHVAQFLEQKLWQPLGMEYPASWSLDSAASGFEKMESGLNERAIDAARFGLLYLHNGRWNGQQIISEAWVKESTAPDPSDQREWLYWPEYPQSGGYYQYHWWGVLWPGPSEHYDFMAAGNFGQYVYVCPQKNLVIVRFGENETAVDTFRYVLYAIEQKVPDHKH